MAARFKAARGYAAGAKAFGVPWSEAGAATGTLSRGTPAPAAMPPGPQALPVDPAYDAATGTAQRNLALSQSGLAFQRRQLGSRYGLGVSDTGIVVEDVSNPNSRAAALQEAYRRAQRGSTNSMAARGQLYSGALQNAQNENANVNQQRRDQMIREFLGANEAINQRGLQATSDFQGAIGQAGSDRLTRALNNRPDPGSVPQATTNYINVVAKPKVKAKPKPRK